ncbi:MAG: DUF3618 domain-containing protein [Actinomycetes bacterium]
MAASNPPSGRTKRQIESDLDATRSHLVDSIEGLIDQVHPKRIKQRQVDNAKQFLHTEAEHAKSLVFTARGDLRTRRLAIVGGVFGAVVALLVVLRTLLRRRQK